MRPGDRLVCAFMEPQTVGTQFSKWLLHITIVPWFRLSDDSAQIARGLQKALMTIKPFKARVGPVVRFGPKKNRPAILIEAHELIEIERRVREYLHAKRAWLVDESTKKPRTFRPHVTFQGDESLTSASQLKIDRLYIVEQKGAVKEVVAEVSLDRTL